jgi:nucleotide-binding universal stress UspA family protein
MNADAPSRSIVVGVTSGQPASVVEQAASFASRFEAELVCAYADTGRYTVEETWDGTVRSVPIDPDLPWLGEPEFPAELEARLSEILTVRGVSWSTRALAGDPANALGHLASTVDALMIVVGTRRASVRGSVQEFLNGSVAVHLAHRQHRPVVVIPLSPISSQDSLPWESAE